MSSRGEQPWRVQSPISKLHLLEIGPRLLNYSAVGREGRKTMGWAKGAASREDVCFSVAERDMKSGLHAFCYGLPTP